MERKAVLQKIAKKQDNSFSLAYTYISVILALNNIHVTKRKKQLMAFIANRGISSVNARKDFCDLYDSSQATINNMTSELTEEGLLVKDDNKYKLNPQLSLDFENDIALHITLSHALR